MFNQCSSDVLILLNSTTSESTDSDNLTTSLTNSDVAVAKSTKDVSIDDIFRSKGITSISDERLSAMLSTIDLSLTLANGFNNSFLRSSKLTGDNFTSVNKCNDAPLSVPKARNFLKAAL